MKVKEVCNSCNGYLYYTNPAISKFDDTKNSCTETWDGNIEINSSCNIDCDKIVEENNFDNNCNDKNDCCECKACTLQKQAEQIREIAKQKYEISKSYANQFKAHEEEAKIYREKADTVWKEYSELINNANCLIYEANRCKQHGDF